MAVVPMTALPMALPVTTATSAQATVTVTSHFVWTSDSANTSGDSAFILNGATDSLPDDLLFVTPNFTAGGLCGCVYEAGAIGVWYDSTNDEWAALREDGGLMPSGMSFNVLVVPKASKSVFVHTASKANITGDYTLFSSKLTNDNPNAIVQVTQVWNPGGSGGVYNPHPVGVFYNSSAGEWAIFNEDGAAMPIGASFNVLVGQAPSNGGKASVLMTTSANQDGDTTLISSPQTTGNPNNVTFVTQNWNPGGVGGTYNNAEVGVWYTGTQEGAFNESQGAMPLDSAFNLLIFPS
jgi:hypothetical protein